jgi:hypothetical protein
MRAGRRHHVDEAEPRERLADERARARRVRRVGHLEVHAGAAQRLRHPCGGCVDPRVDPAPQRVARLRRTEGRGDRVEHAAGVGVALGLEGEDPQPQALEAVDRTRR